MFLHRTLDILIAKLLINHLILHIGGDNTHSRVLLLDNHTSHVTEDLTIKAEQANIFIFTFPGHLIHILQPLDVGVFQPYAYWHRKAVQFATRNLDIEYSIGSFLRDIPEIREKAFTRTTILGAFRKAGIWPIKQQRAFDLMKKYSAPEPRPEPKASELFNLAVLKTPTKLIEATSALSQLGDRLEARRDLFSSPTNRVINSTI